MSKTTGGVTDDVIILADGKKSNSSRMDITLIAAIYKALFLECNLDTIFFIAVLGS